MKILLIFITFCLSLFADIKFSETKYLSALDIKTTKYGSMNIKQDSFIITYTKPTKEIITYLEDRLTLTNNKNITNEYTYEDHPSLEYFGLLLKSIVNDSYENLDNMFEIKDEENIKTLTAKSGISGTIDYIEVLNKDKKLSTIKLFMINKDIITIETIN
jgi:hypothetical protein